METQVLLSCDELSIKDRAFPVTHAQRILDKEREMKVENWKLTDPQFEVKDGIIVRSNKNVSRKSGAKATIK